MWTVFYQVANGQIRAVYVLAQSPEEAMIVAASGVPDEIWDGGIAVVQGHLINVHIDVTGDGRLVKWN